MNSAVHPEPARRLLLCWGYHRAGWIQPFEQLRDRFDVAYLFHRTPEEEDGCATDAPRYYWRDFSDAHDILDRLQPDRIVFMALDGAWSIALNAVAKRHGIPTLIVQHGHLNDDPQQGNLGVSLGQGAPLAALRFVSKSLGPSEWLSGFNIVTLMLDVRKNGVHAALPRHRFDARFPDLYVALSPESASAHVRIDGADPAAIRIIGVPEYDQLFQEVNPEPPSDGTILLIDSPNAENRWGILTVTRQEKIRFLEQLDRAAGELLRVLRVKLHPESFDATWLPVLNNGEYVRGAPITHEVEAASICVGFDSTLVIPAVYLRPTLLFGLRPSVIVDLAEQTGAAQVVRSPQSLTRASLEDAVRRFRQGKDARSTYVRRLASSVDGQATARLAEILANPSSLPIDAR